MQAELAPICHDVAQGTSDILRQPLSPPVQQGADDGMPLMLYPFPAAVIHLDADAFFAAVEQAINPLLKGKPVVTGKERGIIACASYEAKAVGVKRGVSLRDAKKLCPDLVVLPSDYETYSLFSKRMFNIIRRYTPIVEESSVDEAFADLGGMRRVFHASYEQIAFKIKEDIRKELDITASIGVSVTKSLAKLASAFRKPDGITVVEGTRIHLFLRDIPIGKVWGIGPNGVQLCKKYGIETAYDFIYRDEAWVSRLMGKPGRDIWNELRGNQIYPVTVQASSAYASISKTKTFSAPSRDRNFVYARLVRNVESAFIKLRRHGLKAQKIGILLRYSNYEEAGFEAGLNRASSSTQEVMPVVKLLFDRTYKAGSEYRSVMVFLGKLEEEWGSDQLDLFEDRAGIDSMAGASRAIDEINKRFGKHSLSLGTSLFLRRAAQSSRDDPPNRKKHLLSGESKRQRLNIPMMMLNV